ncbi:MAG: TIGR00269 family protein [Thermoprotei archaeon]|nr:MAG: TIGR00269 family protein [Thermoprotei archaeon]
MKVLGQVKKSVILGIISVIMRVGRCKLCGRRMIVHLRYANLSLCEDHFINFFENRVLRTIKRYKLLKDNEKVAVAVSGGKDSIVLLHVLNKLAKDMNFSLSVLHIDLGISGYSNRCRELVEKYVNEYNLELNLMNMNSEDLSIDEIASIKKLNRKLCSICGVIKRYWLNRMAYEIGADKLATGHTLDDADQILIQCLISGDMRQLYKLYPIVYSATHPKLVTRIRPLFESPEEDILLYAKIEGLEFIERPCPYASGALSLDIKKLLNEIESRHPNTKLSIYRNFVKKIRYLLDVYSEGEIGTCKICGFPSSVGECSYCRLKRRVLEYRKR